MKILFLSETTQCDDRFLYLKALVEALADNDYEPTIIFTTSGAPSDHTYQLVKKHVVHHLSKLSFESENGDYLGKLVRHIEKHEYDFLVVSQERFPGFSVTGLFSLLQHKPRLVYLGADCSDKVTQDCRLLAPLEPVFVAVSQMVAERFMSDYEVQIIHGPAIAPDTLGVDIRAEFGIPKNTKLLGYIGNVDHAILDVVIEACKRMRCGLLVAGVGDTVAALDAMGGPVKVVPALPQCRGDWYHAVDVFLYPVKWSGFPMLPLEAAMCGKPVAMTPVSDLPRMAGERFGFFVRDASSVVNAVKTAVMGDVASNKAWVAETFSREQFLTKWQIVFG